MTDAQTTFDHYYEFRGPLFDNSYKPVYVFAYPPPFDRETMVDAYEELVHAAEQSIGPFAMLIDLSRIEEGNAEGRKLAASYADQLNATLSARHHCVGAAIVAGRAWQRGLITAFTWLRRSKQDYPMQTFAERKAAFAWLRGLLDDRLRASR